MFDPIDGSINIYTNLFIGAIFEVFRRISELWKPSATDDFLQSSIKKVAAGYIVYGSSGMLVYATRRGINGFKPDPSIDEFCLSHPDILIV